MKKTRIFICFLLIITIALSLIGCTTYSELQNAYDVAKENGYTGSVSEWLESLQGKSAYQIWLSAGNTGSEEDFLASLSNTVNNYNVNITSDQSTVSVSKALMSVVSVYSAFSTTYRVRTGLGYEEYNSDYSAAGSGVIYKLDKQKGDAYIITNYHVVYDIDNKNTESGISGNISVYLYGREYEQYKIPVTYVGGSKYYDIAVLKITDSNILRSSDAMAAELNTSNVTVGETAVAVGNPEAYGISATRGIVCVDSETITMSLSDGSGNVVMRVIRIDTAINSGNSGGGLFNEKGQLIGITNAKIIDTGTENIAYAIPTSIAASVAQNIIDYCADGSKTTMQRCLIGITVGVNSSKAVYDQSTGKINIVEGVDIAAITSGGLADGKLIVDDKIVSITIGAKTYYVTRTFHVVDAMLNVRVGDTVKINIIRDGVSQTVELSITQSCVTSY